MWRIPFAFLKRDFLEAKSYHFAFYFDFFATLLNCLVLYFLAKLLGASASPHLAPYGGDLFAFLILGEAIYRFLEAGMNVFSEAVSREMNRGTLESLFTTQVSPTAAVISSGLWPLLFAAVRLAVYLIFGVFFFHLNLAKPNLLGSVAVLILTILIHVSLGVAAVGFLLVTKRGNALSAIVNYLTWVFGGVYFPVTLFPESLRWISNFLPITYGLDALRKLIVEGVPLAWVADDCRALLLFAGLLIPLSFAIFRIGLWRAHVKGDLAHY